MKVYELKDGDKVQFGVATSPDVPPEFIYQYYTALKVKQARTCPLDETDRGHQQLKRFKSCKEAQVRS